jgi:Transglutaminase-like superfamily
MSDTWDRCLCLWTKGATPMSARRAPRFSATGVLPRSLTFEQSLPLEGGTMDEPSRPVTTVASWLTMEVTEPACIAFQLAVTPSPAIAVDDQLTVKLDGRAVPATEILDARHSRQHLVQVDSGTLAVTYRGAVTHHGPRDPEALTDPQRLSATRPSRYCPSDRMSGFARGHFADVPTGPERIRAICEYVWRHTAYVAGVTGPTSDAIDTLLSGQGVCRDFAHLVVALCRTMDVPARVAAVYAPGLSPMDFHVVAEAAADGAWWVWDATRLAPRQTLVRIATGQDAADIAFMAVLSGRTELSTMEIAAVAGADLPYDDHEQLIALG